MIFCASILSKKSLMEEATKGLFRTSLRLTHSTRMCLTVGGYWQVPHSGKSSPEITKECVKRVWPIRSLFSNTESRRDCGRRRRKVYDKLPQRYTKDNRTVHLTARSDKSVACVTNNKRLYSTFCTVVTDRHESLRGLFATAELLVDLNLMLDMPIKPTF